MGLPLLAQTFAALADRSVVPAQRSTNPTRPVVLPIQAHTLLNTESRTAGIMAATITVLLFAICGTGALAIYS
jgi:hypothetical protein